MGAVGRKQCAHSAHQAGFHQTRSPHAQNLDARSGSRGAKNRDRCGRPQAQLPGPAGELSRALRYSSITMEGVKRSKQRLDRFRGNRFCQMMVAACFERAAPVVLLTPTRYGNENDVATPRRRPNLPRQLVPIEIWQTDVEQKHMRTERPGEFERPSARISRLHVMT